MRERETGRNRSVRNRDQCNDNHGADRDRNTEDDTGRENTDVTHKGQGSIFSLGFPCVICLPILPARLTRERSAWLFYHACGTRLASQFQVGSSEWKCAYKRRLLKVDGVVTQRGASLKTAFNIDPFCPVTLYIATHLKVLRRYVTEECEIISASIVVKD